MVAIAIPSYDTRYRPSRTKVGQTGQLPGALTRRWNNLKYGDSKLKQ